MRNMKNLLSILSIWIRNDVVMNEEDDEAERRCNVPDPPNSEEDATNDTINLGN